MGNPSHPFIRFGHELIRPEPTRPSGGTGSGSDPSAVRARSEVAAQMARLREENARLERRAATWRRAALRLAAKGRDATPSPVAPSNRQDRTPPATIRNTTGLRP